MKPCILDAILSLVPDASVSVRVTDGVETVMWQSPEVCPVTDEAIQAELSRLLTEYKNSEYKQLRAAAYPPIGDQLDALFHAGVFPAEMAAKLQAVKDQHPKP